MDSSFAQPGAEAQFKWAQRLYQQQQYDSAIEYLKPVSVGTGTNIRLKANACNLLSKIYQKKGQASFGNYYDSLAVPLMLQLKDSDLLMESLYRQAGYFYTNGQYEQAEQLYNKILLLGVEKKDVLKAAEINNRLGAIYLAKKKYETAGNYLSKALQLYKNKQDDKGIADALDYLSTLYSFIGKRSEALQYQIQSKEYREKAKDKIGLCLSNIAIGKYKIMADQFDAALPFFQQAVSLANEVDNNRLKANAAEAMVIYYRKTDKFKEAFPWQKRAIEFFESLGDKEKLSTMYSSIAQSYHWMGDSTQAIHALDKSLSTSLQTGDLQKIAGAYLKLSWFYEEHKNANAALGNYKNYVEYNDSLRQKDKISNIEVFKFLYQTEKKENELNKLMAQEQLQQLILEKQAAQLEASLLETKAKRDQVSLLANNKEINELTIADQLKEIEKQKLIAENSKQQQLLAQKEKLLADQQLLGSKKVRNLLVAGLALLGLLGWVFFSRFRLKKKLEQQQALNSIRNTISNDLHDEIGSTLTSISILSQVSQQALQHQPEKAGEMLQQIASQSRQIQQNMSDIVWSIKPDNEKFENLLLRMKEFASGTLEQQDIKINFSEAAGFDEINLPVEYRRDILLIFKESINNIAKHANATEVWVNIEINKKALALSIKDNGTWARQAASTGSGIASMKQRALSMQGSLETNILSGQTEVLLKLPLPASHKLL